MSRRHPERGPLIDIRPGGLQPFKITCHILHTNPNRVRHCSSSVLQEIKRSHRECLANMDAGRKSSYLATSPQTARWPWPNPVAQQALEWSNCQFSIDNFLTVTDFGGPT